MLQEICVLGRSSCELNYTCVHLCPPKNRHQDRVRNVSNLLLKYLWWIKKRKKEKVERASDHNSGLNLKADEGKEGGLIKSYILQPSSTEILTHPIGSPQGKVDHWERPVSPWHGSYISHQAHWFPGSSQRKLWLWRKHYGVSRQAVAGLRKPKQVCLHHYSLAERVNWASLGSARRLSFLLVASLQGWPDGYVRCVPWFADCLSLLF